MEYFCMRCGKRTSHCEVKVSDIWKPFMEEYGLEKLNKLPVHELIAAYWYYIQVPRNERGLKTVFSIFDQDVAEA